jgi:hemoglobin/transferrin/lactoferrin receptor protein
MIKKQTVLFLLLVALFQQISAQQITLIDESNLQPIENVMIFDENHRVMVLTNSKGNASIHEFSNDFTIIISHPSYEIRQFSKSELAGGPVIYLKEKVIKLSEVVISHNRWEQRQSDIASKVSIIPAKTVALQNPQTAADLIGTSNEVFIQKSQMGGGSPMIRGFATNRVLIAVDGVRMNNAIFRSGNLQNIISIDPYTIQETEILFGPGSVIYGSDAIGGVMSFTTLRPSFSDTSTAILNGQIASRVSSANNEFTTHFNIGVGFQKWAFLSSFTQSNYNDLRMGSYGPDDYLRNEFVQRINGVDTVVPNKNPKLQVPTGFSQTYFMQKVRFKPNRFWEANYSFLYSTTSNYSRYDRLIRYKNGLPRSAEWYYGPQKWMMNNLSLTSSLATTFYDEINIRMSHQLFEESRYDRGFNDSIKFERIENVAAYAVNFDFRKQLMRQMQMYYGAEWVFNKVNSEGTDINILSETQTPGPARYPLSNWSSYAAYATFEWNLSNYLKLNSGLRYNYFVLNATFDDTFYSFPFSEANLRKGAVTGSLGAIYNPNESMWLSAIVSTGFRTPNVDDIGKIFDPEPETVIVPNPELESEYAYNAELSYTQILNNFLKLDATVYYTVLNNAMVRRDFQFNGADSIVYDGEMSKVVALQNAAKASIYGIQGGLNIKIPGGIGIKSRINYQKGREEMDDGTISALRHAAPLFGSTHITYATSRLNLAFYALYNAMISYENLPIDEQGKDYLYAKDGDGNPYVPSWYTLNAKVLYQMNPILSISFGIENITDQRYRPYSSGITAAGRNFIASVKAQF